MRLTRIDLNSWILEIAGQTVLIDPWLVESLIFYGLPWLFKGERVTPVAYTPETLPPIDLILISQGLDDHCHRPTLKQLNRSIPVIASMTAAGVVRELGYTDVTALSSWQEYIFQDKLQIIATPGAKVQGQVENGYLFKDLVSGKTVYYEPHLFSPEYAIAKQFPQIDVAIAPVIAQFFPLLGQLIMGPKEAFTLVQSLRPRIFVPTSMGDLEMSGILPMLTKSAGSLEEFRNLLVNSNLPTQLLTPNPGEKLEI